MASAHILINGVNSQHNQQLRALVDELVRVRNRARQLKDVFDQTALGGDWPALAELLGLESATDAETIYNLLGSVVTELAGESITQMCGRLG